MASLENDEDVPPLEDMSNMYLHKKVSPIVQGAPPEKSPISVATVSQVISPATDKPSTTAFGGFAKGFLNSGSSASPSKQAPVPRALETAESMPFLKASKASRGQLEEVQTAMKEATPFLKKNEKEWLTPELLEKFQNHDMLRYMSDPKFAAILTEFQTNPEAAQKKYGDNKQVMEFFRQFMGVMGQHLSEVGEKKEKEKKQMTPAKAAAPEDIAVNDILKDPEVVTILQDPWIKNMFEIIRVNPDRSAAIMAEAMSSPLRSAQLRKLHAKGLLGIQQK